MGKTEWIVTILFILAVIVMFKVDFSTPNLAPLEVRGGWEQKK
ncbi:MAG: hypothetical protein ABIJ57_08680 [Pseudomonadota bacterium]